MDYRHKDAFHSHFKKQKTHLYCGIPKIVSFVKQSNKH